MTEYILLGGGLIVVGMIQKLITSYMEPKVIEIENEPSSEEEVLDGEKNIVQQTDEGCWQMPLADLPKKRNMINPGFESPPF